MVKYTKPVERKLNMTNIELFVEPSTFPKTWKNFLKEAPVRSVALDGYVMGKPRWDKKKVIQNFNHHEEVDRLSTRCTCAQILNAIRLDFFQQFRNEDGEVQINIFVNDCDEDVCLSVYLLRNGIMAESVINPKLNRLVNVEDALDTTSGAYPYPKDLPMLREMAWVFEPYRSARKNGFLHSNDPQIYRQVIDTVGDRIHQYITGNGKEITLNTKYEIIESGQGWKMVKEIGEYARTAMYADGIKAFVSVTERKDGRYNYIIGKNSLYVPFDIEKLFKRLNEVEGLKEDAWGGGDIIGGSPRVAGSSLTPQQVKEIVEEVLSGKKKKIIV